MAAGKDREMFHEKTISYNLPIQVLKIYLHRAKQKKNKERKRGKKEGKKEEETIKIILPFLTEENWRVLLTWWMAEPLIIFKAENKLSLFNITKLSNVEHIHVPNCFTHVWKFLSSSTLVKRSGGERVLPPLMLEVPVWIFTFQGRSLGSSSRCHDRGSLGRQLLSCHASVQL